MEGRPETRHQAASTELTEQHTKGGHIGEKNNLSKSNNHPAKAPAPRRQQTHFKNLITIIARHMCTDLSHIITLPARVAQTPRPRSGATTNPPLALEIESPLPWPVGITSISFKLRCTQQPHHQSSARNKCVFHPSAAPYPEARDRSADTHYGGRLWGGGARD